jgi:putative transposase
MDERYVVAAARYIELNPVRGKWVKKAWEYPWSSARAHVEEKNDGLVKVGPMLAMVGDWEKFLEEDATEDEAKKLRQHERTGRPLGNEQFVMRLEKLTGRMLRKRKPGPKGAGKTENR